LGVVIVRGHQPALRFEGKSLLSRLPSTTPHV
jgi:hypothetical protein